MNDDKPVWAELMADSPFADRHFTTVLEDNVIHSVRETRQEHLRIYKVVAAAIALAILWLVIGLDAKMNNINSSHEVNVKMVERKAYYDHGRLLFSVAPQPNARAGETNGYMFHFEEPLGTYMGKTLTIQAVQLLTGTVEMVSSEVIATPSPGYPGLERYTVRFALPLEGIWRLDVLLDDKTYGDVTVLMNKPSWETSPLFQSGKYLMRGNENQDGFIDAGFIAGKSQKYMWHFWGTEAQLNGPFEIKAVKEHSDTIIQIFSSNPLSSSNALASELNGADRSAQR
ncbi:hypothetical protein [Paenibacillus sp. N3.4]|uniref:hypothetical protein n=1 Tax=Paenibacillus sp. N3.4 TaxID=2603222 RepID=UPI0011C78A3D|nr:hypothetical protein [Paenibacillus sp. N3.4]TXK72381.1 hypothetical protein FU659_31305 [Paenibacillus sp. N3.4]